MRQNAYVSNFWRRIRRGAPKLTSKFPSIEKALKRVQHSAITSFLVELEDHMFILSALTAARGGDKAWSANPPLVVARNSGSQTAFSFSN